jgi:hypothetical protein
MLVVYRTCSARQKRGIGSVECYKTKYIVMPWRRTGSRNTWMSRLVGRAERLNGGNSREVEERVAVCIAYD